MEARLDAPDVLIVGAGVVGATLAYEVARGAGACSSSIGPRAPHSERRAGAWAAPTGSSRRRTTACATSAARGSNATRS